MSERAEVQVSNERVLAKIGALVLQVDFLQGKLAEADELARGLASQLEEAQATRAPETPPGRRPRIVASGNEVADKGVAP